MSAKKRKRDVPVLFWVSDAEMEAIQQKMAQFGTKNLSAYLVLCQEKVQIKYALLMLSYPAKASALSSNAAIVFFFILIWRKISTMAVCPHCVIKCFYIFEYQLICMPVIKNFKRLIHSLFSNAWNDSIHALSHGYAFFE